jgi:hypothetical protein
MARREEESSATEATAKKIFDVEVCKSSDIVW